MTTVLKTSVVPWNNIGQHPLKRLKIQINLIIIIKGGKRMTHRKRKTHRKRMTYRGKRKVEKQLMCRKMDLSW
jgi:hypothetical protein